MDEDWPLNLALLRGAHFFSGRLVRLLLVTNPTNQGEGSLPVTELQKGEVPKYLGLHPSEFFGSR